jgi:hypothetical protein
MPRGGRRPGAGRKPKPRPVGEPARVLAHPSVPPPSTNYPPPAPIEEFDAPDALTAEERAVWMLQAPHAFQNRTLTKATALAFERYCRVVVLERAESVGSSASGPNHRGLLKQINQFELQFLLSPNGRPMAAPQAASAAPAESALARFRS